MPERAKDELEIFTGSSNPALAREVCEHLGVRLGEAEVGRFPDGEVMVEVRENVRGGDCFVLQSICTPPNDNLMELLLLMDALRRASAKRISAMIPYFGYSRQDRKVAPRVPISAKLVADVVTAAGASRWSRPTPAAWSGRALLRGGSTPTSRSSTNAARARARWPRCNWSAKCGTPRR